VWFQFIQRAERLSGPLASQHTSMEKNMIESESLKSGKTFQWIEIPQTRFGYREVIFCKRAQIQMVTSNPEQLFTLSGNSLVSTFFPRTRVLESMQTKFTGNLSSPMHIYIYVFIEHGVEHVLISDIYIYILCICIYIYTLV
jgi:hypothetical protein